MTTIAVHTPPAIVCPVGCEVLVAEHLADLADLEGFVIHYSSVSQEGAQHSRATDIDNTPDEQPAEDLPAARRTGRLGLDQAEVLARAVLNAVQDARGQCSSCDRP